VFIDNDLGAATHVRKTVSLCFAALRQLRYLRRYVTDDYLRLLMISLVHTRLDYSNFVLVGLPTYLQRRLQSSTPGLVSCTDSVATTTSLTPS